MLNLSKQNLGFFFLIPFPILSPKKGDDQLQQHRYQHQQHQHQHQLGERALLCRVSHLAAANGRAGRIRDASHNQPGYLLHAHVNLTFVLRILFIFLAHQPGQHGQQHNHRRRHRRVLRKHTKRFCLAPIMRIARMLLPSEYLTN